MPTAECYRRTYMLISHSYGVPAGAVSQTSVQQCMRRSHAASTAIPGAVGRSCWQVHCFYALCVCDNDDMDTCCSQLLRRNTNLARPMGVSLWCSGRVVKGTATSIGPAQVGSTHVDPTQVGPTHVGPTCLLLNHIQFASIIVLNINIVNKASVIFTVVNTSIYNVMRGVYGLGVSALGI